jgi:putative PIN family toxin of toxin-antitoxin system
LRLVIDTNIAVSALAWRGTPYQLLSAIRERLDSIHLMSSETLLVELAEVLSRPHLSKRLATIGQTPAQLLTDYVQAVELATPTEVRQVVRDPDDDHVIACALAGHADLIVSGDRDLLNLGAYQNIRIVTARQAIEIIASDASQ